MENMVKNNVAPIGAVIPEQIPQAGLWKLDVDDSIWQDIGLDEDADIGLDKDADYRPPLWLKDDKVRAGIRHLLDYDHCLEEEVRLTRERLALQEGARDEWNVLCTAIASIGRCTRLMFFQSTN